MQTGLGNWGLQAESGHLSPGLRIPRNSGLRVEPNNGILLHLFSEIDSARFDLLIELSNHPSHQ